jgi:uncharacterized membrane protein
MRPEKAAASKLVGILGALFALLYPVGVYIGLTRLNARLFGVGLASLLLVGLGLRLNGRERAHALVAARIPLTVVALLATGALLDDRRVFLALPVVTNLALLAHFAVSLRTIPVAERFARAHDDELSSARVAYCRAVTIMWCVFFVVNGGITAVLGLFAPLGWWALYTGALSYIALGSLALGEYFVRRARFGKYTRAHASLGKPQFGARAPNHGSGEGARMNRAAAPKVQL